MTVHVLHAGDGYTYLTRQVASHDVQRARGESLSDYYVHDGNPPGRWVGEGLGALGVTGEVSESQMKALFGEGRHPDADAIEQAMVREGVSVKDALRATQLGRRFPQFKDGEDDGFAAALSSEHESFRDEHGRDAEPGVERARLRRAAAGRVLAAAGKPFAPADIARYLARSGGAPRQPVAGYDLVFTPVKSVSVLWALGDDAVQSEVSAAHEAAWRGAMVWLETEAAVTRVGSGGLAQVDTRGLVATAFDHIDSRAGDPNLHTHVAVSNKVQGLDGKWRSLDGRVLHALGVAASERYNTLIEAELTRRLGVQFEEQFAPRGRRAVRELAGVPASLREEFSARRASIEAEFSTLVAAYRAEHGHDPSKAVQYKMAQQATLSTRQAKEEGVALSTRRAQWRERATRVLGSEHGVDHVVRSTIERTVSADVSRPAPSFDALAAQVMSNLAAERAVWTIGHVQAEAQRVARTQLGTVDPSRIGPLAEQLVDAAVQASLPLTPPEMNPVPDVLRRTDRVSVYRQHATERFTTLDMLDAEQRLLTAARTPSGFVVSADLVVGEGAATSAGAQLNDAQLELARRFACGGHLVEAGIGPAGAGKTSAMSHFAGAVHAAGGRVLGLAPSAAAAAVLGDELGVRADTIHKLLHAHTEAATGGPEVPDELRLDPRTILLVDEAGMASTPDLDALIRLASRAGSSVRLLGDPAQLQAVGAGGVLRLIDEQVGAAHLEQVHRFVTDGEAAASLALREGDSAGVDFYIDAGRTLGGSREAMIEEVYAAWQADHHADKTTLMIAATREDVLALAVRARLDRVTAGEIEAGGVRLHDGSTAGVGDLVVTRENDRRLRIERGTDFVKNGDVWTVVERADDGSLRLKHRSHQGFVTVPGDYVEGHVELAYATTIHRAQGMTVDTAHYLVDAAASREQLYTGATRGRAANHLYVAVEELLDPDLHAQPGQAQPVRESLLAVLERTDATPSATSTLNAEHEQAASLATLVPQYEDVWERAVAADVDEHLRAVVADAVPDLVDQVLSDPAWPTLRARLLQHERHGLDPATALQVAAAHRELKTAESIADVLAWRIGAPAGTPGGRLPAWVTPPPERTAAAPASPEPATVAPGGSAPLDPAIARVMSVNEAAWQVWREHAGDEASWVPGYLQARGLVAAEAGHAPAGWTSTIDVLRAQGFSDEDLLEAGIATLSRRGQLIDRFRDRLVIPVLDEHDRVRAFTARVSETEEFEGASKYINSPETPAYVKGERLLGLDADAVARLRAGATPVLVEGAMDRAAVASLGNDYVPLAPCGTAVTHAQLDVLRALVPGGLRLVVAALDGDEAGQKATGRLWSLLQPAEAAQVRAVTIPSGADPADLVEAGRVHELRDLLSAPRLLREVVVDRALDQWNLEEWVEHRVAATRAAAQLVAALPPSDVAAAAAQVQARLGDGLDPMTVIDAFMGAHLDALAARASTEPDPASTPANTAASDAGDGGAVSAPAIDERVADWLRAQSSLIAARLDGLVAQVEYAPPAWAAAAVRPIPEDPDAAEQWRRDVRIITAYRDQWDITSSEPVPAERTRGAQEDARADAAAALLRVAATAQNQRPRATGIERARLRVQTDQRVAQARTQAQQQRTQPASLEERVAALRHARQDAANRDATDGTLDERVRRLREEQEAATRPDEAPATRRPEGPQL